MRIWENLLQRVTAPAVSSDVQIELLGKHVLNGRQIKNAVRLAVSWARERASDVTQAILESTLRITTLGREHMKMDDSWKGA